MSFPFRIHMVFSSHTCWKHIGPSIPFPSGKASASVVDCAIILVLLDFHYIDKALVYPIWKFNLAYYCRTYSFLLFFDLPVIDGQSYFPSLQWILMFGWGIRPQISFPPLLLLLFYLFYLLCLLIALFYLY